MEGKELPEEQSGELAGSRSWFRGPSSPATGSPPAKQQNHSVQVLDLRLRNHNPDAGLGRDSASAWGVRRGSRGQRQQGAWDRATETTEEPLSSWTWL